MLVGLATEIGGEGMRSETLTVRAGEEGKKEGDRTNGSLGGKLSVLGNQLDIG